MKPLYKFKSWVPVPYVTANPNHKDCNCEWMDFWIGLTHNKSPGIENFLGKEIRDYALFHYDEQDSLDVIDFWRGISSKNHMTDYLLKNFNETFDGITSIGENIKWKYLFEHNDSPFVVDFCKKYPEKIHWDSVCKNNINDSLIAYAGNYPQHLDWDSLSKNELPSAVDILKKYPDKVTDNIVYNGNPDAFELLENMRKKIRWDVLEHYSHYFGYPNQNTIKLFEKYFNEMENYIDWEVWSKSPDAISFLEKNPDKINWKYFCWNEHPTAIEMIKQNKDKINWEALCRNKSPDIVDFLDDNLEKLNLDVLMNTCHPNCIKIIEKYWNNKDFTFLFGNRFNILMPDNIHENIPSKFLEMGPNGQYVDRVALTYYSSFAERPECIHLLKDAFENGTKLEIMEECSNFYRSFYSNPAIFELDTEAMKGQNKQFAEELMAKVFHPERVERIIKKYNYNILTEELCYQSDTDEE